MDGWSDFFFAQLGAAAALGGLLFVAISLNLTRILSVPNLPGRALAALGLLLGVLVIASLMLVPRQPALLLGIETLAVAAALATLALRHGAIGAGDVWKAGLNALLFALAILPYGAGGLFFLAGDLPAGAYCLAAGVIFSVIKAVADAWVLLVEINR